MIILLLLFLVLISIFLALDLGVFHKSNQVITIKESLLWTLVWVILALIFGGAIKAHNNFLGIKQQARS